MKMKLNLSFQENAVEMKDLLNERDYLQQIIQDNDEKNIKSV